MTEKSHAKRGVLKLVLLFNLVVAVAKIAVGFFAGIPNLTADGFHSLGDTSSNIIGLVGIRFGEKPPDEKFPYGYSKFETIAALVVNSLLLVVVVELAHSAWDRFWNPAVPDISTLAIVTIIITTLINIGVFVYERHKASELKSEFLKFDAHHTLSDVFVSSSVLVGLLCAGAGYPLADPLASLVVVFFILQLVWGNLKEATEVLCDSNQIPKAELEAVAGAVPGVRFCHAARSRGRKDAVFVDLHIGVDPRVPFADAHEISHKVDEKLREYFPQITGTSIHIEPVSQEKPCC